MTQRYKRLHRGSGYEIGLWCCEHPEPTPHEYEHAAAYEVIFPIGGAFVRETGGRRHFADATRVLFSNRDDAYRVFHPVAGGDRCTVLTVADRLVEEIAASSDALVADGDSHLGFPMLTAPIGGELYRANRRLNHDITRELVDEVEVDARVYELLDATVRTGRRRPGRSRPRSQRLHRLAVERAIEGIHARFRGRLTLDEIARDAAYSAFHFARLFRDYTGLTVHDYVNRLRLRSALEAVLEGAPDLTAVALSHGFSSHSHFTAAFRREFGTTPSAAR